MFKILAEIKYFGFVFGLSLFAFTNSYYLLGRNQIQFGEVDPYDEPGYATFQGALWTVW